MAKGRPKKVLMGEIKSTPISEENTLNEVEQVNESKGLGDTLEKGFKAIGIDKLVKFIAGEDCGCEERKEKLNKMFPYKRPLCLTEEEYLFLKEFFELNNNVIIPSVQKRLLTTYNRVFSERNEPTTCASCIKAVLQKLRKVYDNY